MGPTDGVYTPPVTAERGGGTTFHPAAVGTDRGVVLVDTTLPDAGHMPGHLSLHPPETGVLLTATRSPARTANSGRGRAVHARRCGGDPVGRLADLDVDRVHCFHGGPTDEGTAGVERVYDGMRDRRDA